MAPDRNDVRSFLSSRPPFDLIAQEPFDRLVAQVEELSVAEAQTVYAVGDEVPGLFVVVTGSIEIISPDGDLVSRVGARDFFGERGLLRDGYAPSRAVAAVATRLYLIPKTTFLELLATEDSFAGFFRAPPSKPAASPDGTLLSMRLGDLMTRYPECLSPDQSVGRAAERMRDLDISCVLVTEQDRLTGVLTTGDLATRVLAEGGGGDLPIGQVMSRDPLALPADASGFDALVAMAERGIGHLPVVVGRRPVGIVTRTNILRHQSVSAVSMIGEIARRDSAAALTEIVAGIPQLLVQLVGAGSEPHIVGRLITSIADATTIRLLQLGEARLGPPPVPYLWLACGSQGRQEQTGVSDQDNCMILSEQADDADAPYFAELAQFVCDGLETCGYYHCPGEMMATNPRWRQPLATWRRYFSGWIAAPDPMAQMLSSVMFDLRPIAGEMSLFETLQAETLAKAQANSIFLAHMISNALKHTPPLSLFRGFALIRDKEHRDTLDLKLSGVVPVVDLARVYAIMGRLPAVNTRERLIQARQAGVISQAGGHDLIDAFQLIAETRLQQQARQIRAGEKPNNFMPPTVLSEFERSHLRNAFVVVKTMQSALAQGRHTVV